jgi:hypothetical protein
LSTSTCERDTGFGETIGLSTSGGEVRGACCTDFLDRGDIRGPSWLLAMAPPAIWCGFF